ncbi:MAG: glycosyltransferase family 2 protein [Oscillospiraceae bacterium]|nr:glycosyltransferase family 2 protein [Oscillospiraceae bacterium]
MNNVLYIVVPCYNEEAVLDTTASRLQNKVTSLKEKGYISTESKVVFVDDGSRDSTWDIISSLCERDSIFAGIKLARNRGHQSALFAGLMTVREEADMVISIDADLQDDIETIDKMVLQYINGNDIVYGVRSNRESDSFFKRATAEGYYKFLRSLGCDIVFNHADYRLMSSRALNELSEYSEQRLFLRGIIPLLGYKTSIVEYTRGIREVGESKYPLKRMLSLAMDGLLSLSLRPIRIILSIGVIMLIFAAIISICSIVLLFQRKLLFDWVPAVLSIWFVGGVVTLSLGVVGEYVGRTFFETKQRPRYNIETSTGLNNGVK